MRAVYGASYRFFEKIKLGGIGSPRMFYLSGINELDELIYLHQPPIVLIESLRESFYFHLHTHPNAQHYVWAIKKEDVKVLSAETYENIPDDLQLDTQSLIKITFLFRGMPAHFGFKTQVQKPLMKYLQKHNLIN